MLTIQTQGHILYHCYLIPSFIKAELHLKVNAQPNLSAQFLKLVLSPSGWLEEWHWGSPFEETIPGDWGAAQAQVQSELMKNEDGWGTPLLTHCSHPELGLNGFWCYFLVDSAHVPSL